MLTIHLDTSYPFVCRKQSYSGGPFFICIVLCENKPIQLNSNFHILCAIFKIIAASTTEVELEALFPSTTTSRYVG